MRVAVITTGFAAHEKDYGGAGAILTLTKQLSDYNDIELVFFSFYYPIGKTDYFIDKIKIYSFAEKPAPGKLEKIRIWRKCESKFADEQKKNRFELIHAMWSGESGYIGARLSRKYNIPMITNVNGGELGAIPEIKYGHRLKFFQKYFVNKSFRKARKIICGSDFIISKIKQNHSSDIFAKAIKLPFGIDDSIFKTTSKKFDIHSPVLINIANAVSVKSHTTLFSAVKKVIEKIPQTKLLCYGRDDNDLLKKMVSDFGIDENVSIKGFIEYEKIPRALNNADIFVLSSLYESQNMSVLEAAFCGLPVVSSDVGVAPEITPHIVPAGDSQALADKIFEVIQNPAVNYNNLFERFSIEKCAERFHNLYLSFL